MGLTKGANERGETVADDRLPLDERADEYKKRFLRFLMGVPESSLDSAQISLISAFRFMANELGDERERSIGRGVLVLDARHALAIDTILAAFGKDPSESD